MKYKYLKQYMNSHSFLLVLLLSACNQQKAEDKFYASPTAKDFVSFQDDLAFMNKHTDLIELKAPSGDGIVAVSAALQGRVMTSSSSGPAGRSYGWINRALFSSGDTLEHINVYGGEERFWIGPEGGQYSIFFKHGDDFNLSNWYTPRLIDLAPFNLKESTAHHALFTKKATLTNYSDFEFEFEIERKVDVLSDQAIEAALGVDIGPGLRSVAYRTTNSLTNVGDANWQKETGLLSIWLLGMYNASANTTVVIPFRPGSEESLGKPVTDDYFGKVPTDRLVVRDSVLYFSGDAKCRSKIGLSPSRARNILGSYDSENNVLTIIKYNKPEGVTDYVNSLWEIQDKPYQGDVVNSYNDGPPVPGEKQLGKFYELETSSPALELRVGEKSTHIQLTCHFEGDEKLLNTLTEELLDVSLSEISDAINLEGQ